jgi:anti-anti-sigma factor
VLDLIGSIETAELGGGKHIVAAHGPLDSRVAGVLNDALLPLAAGGPLVVLDLEDAHGLDDTVMAIVSSAAYLVRRRGASLSVVTRSPIVLELIEHWGLTPLVLVRSSLREAIEHE